MLRYITVGEFHWESVDWVGGWSAADPRPLSATNLAPNSMLTKKSPDVTLIKVLDRCRAQDLQIPELQDRSKCKSGPRAAAQQKTNKEQNDQESNHRNE
jgi:hypothetical protein